MKPVLYYCYDAYCGWCYGFSSVIKKLWEQYRDQLDFEVLSGGMIPADNPVHISRMSSFLAESYKTVEQTTGVTFGADWLWHVLHPDESDWYPSSEKPAIAMAVFREYYPDLQVPFAADLQYSLYFEGRDLTDNEAYRHLLHRYQVPAKEFYEKLHDENYKEKAYYDFALCRQLQVTGFPAVLLQVSDSKFYLLARGYTAYEDMEARLENVLSEIRQPLNSEE